MKSDHTPGPWSFNGLATIQSEKHCIAVVHQLTGQSSLPSPEREQEEANARLIAAAPDLLQALEALYSSAPCAKPANAELWEALQLTREAIRKARGE